MKSTRLAWTLWIIGVVLFPIGGLLTKLQGPLPIPVLFFSGMQGLIAWLVWGLAFVLMTVALVRLDGASRRLVLIAQIVGGVIMATTPILPSHDPFAYFLYGDMAMHHENVWRPPLLPADRDQVVAAGIIPWHNPPVPCVYSPVFVAIEDTLVTIVSPHNVIALLFAQRLLSLAAAAGVTLLMRTRAVGSWALHPLVLFEAAVGAHNDALMFFFVAASLSMRRSWITGPLLACAGMIKIVALSAAAYRPKVLLTAAITVALFVFFNHDALAIGQLTQHQDLNPLNSPVMLVRAVLRHGLKLGTYAAVIAKGLIAAAALAGFAFLFLAPAGRVLRRDRPVYVTFLFIAGALSIIYPWYFTWVVFAATFAHRRVRLSAAILCSVSYLLYLQSFVSFAGRIEYPVTIGLWGLVAVVVFFLLRYSIPTSASIRSAASSA